ncbi:MAG: cellulase family glycosylhydrolase [Pseudomonadota bacterium]
MSRLKTFVLSPTRVRSLRRAASICGLGLAMIATSSQVNAACTYTIESQWDNGFSAKIKITNTNSAPISSWSIGWQYAGGNRVLAGSAYNVNLTGSNPYTATNISWNGNIPVGGVQDFGFQGTKTAGSGAEIPAITGAACGGPVTSSSAAVSSTPVRSSTSSSSSVIPTDGPAAISVSGNKMLFGGQVGSISGASMFWSNTGWGAEKYYNAQAVSWLKSDWNAKLVRAAMGVNDTGGYLTDPSNKTRVMAVVDGAIANDMYVIIDFHTHLAQNYKAQSIAFFQEMATKYGNKTNVIYEIYNEPLQVSWSAVIKPYAIDVIKAIRAIDPDNLIIVGTPTWSQDVDVAALDPIVGYGNIAYTLHFYAGTHKQSLRDKAALALSRGIPLFVTEWGSTDASGDGAVNVTETNAWVAFMKANHISNANWSLTDKAEGSAALVAGSSGTGGWQLTTSGALARSITQGWPTVIGGSSSSRSSVAPSSIPTSSKASSVAPSSVRSSAASSRASSSSIVGPGSWQLSATDSYLNFVTTKNSHTIEVHKFDSLSGSLTNAGVATLSVDLASVNTANTLRDQRLRDLFFETGLFPSAIATFNVNTAAVNAIPVGQSALVDLAGTLDLHGVAALMSTKVLVQKATATRVVVQSVAPVIVRSADHNLTAGVEALRSAVGIASVSGIAPVDFVLVFNAQ